MWGSNDRIPNFPDSMTELGIVEYSYQKTDYFDEVQGPKSKLPFQVSFKEILR